MIILPNKFSGINLTVDLKSTNDYWDFSTAFRDKEYIDNRILKQSKNTRHLYVTFSRMISNVNKYKKISYHEVIFKLPVEIDKKKYIYPLISYVDDELSFTRGVYLGYYKKLVNNNAIKFNERKVMFNFQESMFEIDYLTKNQKNVDVLPFDYPFILNYATYVPGAVTNKGLYTLNTSMGEKVSKNLIDKTDIALNNISLFGQKGEINKAWLTRDRFIVDGITKVTDLK